MLLQRRQPTDLALGEDQRTNRRCLRASNRDSLDDLGAIFANPEVTTDTDTELLNMIQVGDSGVES